jgi:hypothetical protein
MPVVIIREAERLSKEIDGATFYYKRVPAHIRNRMMASCTSRRSGNVDWGRYGQMLMDYALLGWDNVIDQSKAEIPFSKEIIGYLPDRIQGELIELFGENTEQLEGELKNSPTTPSSSTSITD